MNPSKSPSSSSLLRALFGSLLLFSIASPGFAQTLLTPATNGTVNTISDWKMVCTQSGNNYTAGNPYRSNVSLDYVVTDTGTLTYFINNTGTASLGTGAAGTGGSAAMGGMFWFVDNAANTMHFTATVSGSTGAIVFNGQAMKGTTAFNPTSVGNTTGRGSIVAGMGAGNNTFTAIAGYYVDPIAGPVYTGTITACWGTTHGAVFYMNTGNNSISLKNFVVSNNGNNSATNSFAGVLYINGGQGLFTAENCIFDHNGSPVYLTGATGNGGSSGGAFNIGSTAGTGSMALTNVVFSNNFTTGTGGATSGNGIGQGGAIYLNTNATLYMNGGTFVGNNANAYATDGSVTTMGGAIQLAHASAKAYLTDVDFQNNYTVIHRTVASASTAYSVGGAISLNAANSVDLTLNKSFTYTGNRGIGLDGTYSGTQGGFLWFQAGGTFNLNVANGQTLTLGLASDINADTIASANTSARININATTNPGYSGTLVLNGDNSNYKGVTNVLAGTLLLGNANAKLGGNINVGAGSAPATLNATTGTFSGNISIGGGSAIATLNAGAATLTSAGNTLSLNANSVLNIGPAGTAQTINLPGSFLLGTGATINFDILSLTSADLINIGGSFLQGTGTSTINITKTFTTGSIALFNATGGITPTFNPHLINLTVNGAASPTGYFAPDAAGNLWLLFGLTLPTNNYVITWTGLVDGSWSGTNWSTVSYGATTATPPSAQGDIVNLAGATAPADTINLATPSTIAGMYLSGPASYTLTGTSITADPTVGFLTGSAAATGKLILGAKAPDDASAPIQDATTTFTGTLTLANGTNNFKGGIDIESGALVGDALTLGSGSVGIIDNSSLTFNQTANASYAAPITGTGLLAKTGSATLTLTASNAAFTGTTSVNAGALILGSTTSSLGGLVNVATGATLGGSGTFTGDVLTSANSTISTVGSTLTIDGTLNLAPATTLHIDNAKGYILQLGNLLIGGTSAIDITSVTTGTYHLINTADGIAASATSDFLTTSNGGAPLSTRTITSYFTTPNDLYLVLNTLNLGNVVWNGTNATYASLWQSGFSNFQTSDGLFVNGDSVIFNDTATGTRTVNVDTAGVQAVDILVNTTGTYTFTGGGITTSNTINSVVASTATGALTIAGPGLVVLSNTAANNFQGGIYLNTGTLQGNALTLGTGTAGITNKATLVFDQAAAGTYASAITGPGALVKSNTGALTLTNTANTYAGAINVLAGSLAIVTGGTTTQGPIAISASSALLVSGAPAYTIQTPLTGSGTLGINLTTATSAVALTTAAGSAFTGVLNLGVSAFTLDAPAAAALANATLSSGTGNTTTAAATVTIGNLALNGGQLNFNATVPPDTAAAGVITTATLALNSGTIQIKLPPDGSGIPNNPAPAGSNLLTQDDGTAKTHLITATTITGNPANIKLVDQTNNPVVGAPIDINESGVTVATGTYTYALAATTTTSLDVTYKLAAIDLIAGQTLHLAPDAGATGPAATLSATISGSGNLSINAANAPVTLAASNNYTGTTTVTSGTLVAGANNALGAPDSSLVVIGSYNLNGHTQTLSTLSGNYSTPSVTLGGPTGTLTITGTSGLKMNGAYSTLDLAGGVLNANGGNLYGTVTGTGIINATGGGYLDFHNANPALNATINISAGADIYMYNPQALGTGTINLLTATSFLDVASPASGAVALPNTITGAGAVYFYNFFATGATGTTVLATPNPAFTGHTYIGYLTYGANVLVTSTAALGNTPVTLTSSGTLTYNLDGTVSNAISGPGVLNLANTTGTLALTGANTVTNINLLDGASILASATSLGNAKTKLTMTNATITLAADTNTTLGTVTMNGASRIAFARPTGTATLANLASTGADNTLAFNTNVGAGASNTLVVTGTMTGTYNLSLNNTGNAPSTGITNLTLVKAPNSANTTYLGTTGSLNFNDSPNYYTYDINPANGATLRIRSTDAIAAAGAAILANAAGAMPLTWFAELDTIEKRLGDLRLNQRSAPAPQLWLRAYAQRLNVNDKDTPLPYNEDQYGTDVGFDYGGKWTTGDFASYIGAFAGMGGASRKLNNMNASGDTTAFNAGLYITYLTDSGWYADAIAKYNHFNNKISAVAQNGPMDARYTNTAIGASIEAGRRIELRNNWYVTPNAQAAITSVSSASYTTDAGATDGHRMAVNIDSTVTEQLRLGALGGWKHTMKNGSILQPYAKLYLARQWAGKGTVMIDSASYNSVIIQGARFDLGAGVNWQATKNLQVYFDYECAWAKDYKKPYGVTAGVTYAW